MTDISHVYGSDLTLSPSGDIAVASGAEATKQRVLRRLLTARGGYVWHRRYGAGLPSFIGQTINAARVRGVITRQMRLERGVGRSPAPTVEVTTTVGGTVTARVRYADQTGAPQQLTVTP